MANTVSVNTVSVDTVPVLELEKVSKSFGPLEILQAVDLTLREGESIAILGPSGAGKSTLLHIAGLMESPTKGSVVLNGKRAEAWSEPETAGQRLNTIGFLFQFHYLLPDLNVWENTLIPCRIAGDNLEKMKDQARFFLTRLGLENRLWHKPHQLSGGEQQRAALARALIRKPKLLLCDEPTGNLDPHTALEVSGLLIQEGRRDKTALIIVTHNENLAAQMDTAYVLRDGTLQKKDRMVAS